MTTVAGAPIVNSNSGPFVGGDQTAVPTMPLAGPNAIFEANSPRALAVINGGPLAIDSYTITLNAYGVLDTAEFVVPIQGNPDFTQWLFQNETDTSAIPVFIYAGFPANPSQPVAISKLQKRFIGQLDQYTIDHAAGKVTFECRSLGAGLTDRRLTTPISYVTSVDLITAQAKLAGLATQISILGAPITMAEVFSREFIAGIKNFRVWDLIVQCAQFDDADVWVDGNTLFYVAPSAIQRNIVYLQVGKNITNLSIVHAQQYNRKIRVEVRTFSPHIRQGAITRVQTRADGTVTQESISRYSTSLPIFGTTGVATSSYSTNGTTGATSSNSGVSSSSGGGFGAGTTPESASGLERYTIYKAGLSPQACTDLAHSQWRSISMHEWALTAELPVTTELFSTLSRTSLLQVSASPYSRVNQKYWPRRFSESFDLSSGMKWSIEALNHVLPLGQV